MGKLTAVQCDLLRFILRCYRDGYLPTLRELAKYRGSNNPTCCLTTLAVLRRKGFIGSGDGRAMRLTPAAMHLSNHPDLLEALYPPSDAATPPEEMP